MASLLGGGGLEVSSQGTEGQMVNARLIGNYGVSEGRASKIPS